MKTTATAIAVIVALTTTAAAELPQPVKARQGQFNIMALNLGVLGGMARGAVEYDAAAAQAAADSLVAVSTLAQTAMWVPGTDNMTIDGTRAEPAIWDNLGDVISKWEAYGAAAKELQAVASDGQGALGPMLGKIGGTCKACHDSYRAPQ